MRFKIALIHSWLENYRYTRDIDKKIYKDKYEEMWE